MEGVTERDETTYAMSVSNADQEMRFSFIYLGLLVKGKIDKSHFSFIYFDYWSHTVFPLESNHQMTRVISLNDSSEIIV